jgi:hypothetical protein
MAGPVSHLTPLAAVVHKHLAAALLVPAQIAALDAFAVRHVVDVSLYDMGGERRRRGVPGWEEGEGVKELFLVGADLFTVRRVRVRTEDVAE